MQVIRWIIFESKDADKMQLLYKVDGLHAMVKNSIILLMKKRKNALLMEFVLHGLAA